MPTHQKDVFSIVRCTDTTPSTRPCCPAVVVIHTPPRVRRKMVLVHEEHGLYVYRAEVRLGCRSMPDVSDNLKISSRIAEVGDLCCVECVQPSRVGSDNGPFLRLANGHGWLFERKYGDRVMHRMAVEHGLWAYRVNNPVVGLLLRSHPTTSQKWLLDGDILCPHEYVVWADARVVDGATTYVRIQGTTGWLFTRRGDVDTLVPVNNSLVSTPTVSAPTTPPLGTQRPLTADAIRAMARCKLSHLGLHEVQHNEVSRVIAFTRGDGDGGTIRINVYYTTGTVSTSLDHPRQGKTQMFRRDCGLREVEEIMTNPRVHTGRGYKRRADISGLLEEARDRVRRGANERCGGGARGGGGGGVDDSDALSVLTISGVDAVVPDTEEGKLRRELRLLDTAMAQMQAQRVALTDHLHSVENASRTAAKLAMEEENRKKLLAAQAEAARVAAERKRAKDEWREQKSHERGKHCCWMLAGHHARKEFTKRCGSEQNFASVEHVAFFGEGEGFFLSRDNGKSFWTQLPGELGSRLVDEGLNTQGCLTYVVGGPHGEYYAELANGSIWWSGNTSTRFNELVRDNNRTVSRVAFGCCSWIVSFTNGRSEWRGIPDNMAQTIRVSRSGIKEMSLGSDESYFVSFNDGSYDYCLPPDCADQCVEIISNGGSVKNVILDPEDPSSGWLIRYTK